MPAPLGRVMEFWIAGTQPAFSSGGADPGRRRLAIQHPDKESHMHKKLIAALMSAVFLAGATFATVSYANDHDKKEAHGDKHKK